MRRWQSGQLHQTVNLTPFAATGVRIPPCAHRKAAAPCQNKDCHLSSAAEQLFCKEKVLGSNPRGGSDGYCRMAFAEIAQLAERPAPFNLPE